MSESDSESLPETRAIYELTDEQLADPLRLVWNVQMLATNRDVRTLRRMLAMRSDWPPVALGHALRSVIQVGGKRARLPLLKALLDAGAIPNIHPFGFDYALLHDAALRAQTDVVELLVQRGADLELMSGMGRGSAAECVATLGGARECVDSLRVLINAGCSLRAQHNNGSLLHVAAQNCRLNVLQFLLRETSLDVFERRASDGKSVLECCSHARSSFRKRCVAAIEAEIRRRTTARAADVAIAFAALDLPVLLVLQLMRWAMADVPAEHRLSRAVLWQIGTLAKRADSDELDENIRAKRRAEQAAQAAATATTPIRSRLRKRKK